MKLTLRRPRRLQLVPELGPFEVNAGALTTAHIGNTIAIRKGRNILTGPLEYAPTKSMTKPLLVLRVGEFTTALHPAHPVMVIPDGWKATITVAPKPDAVTDKQGRPQ